MKSFVLTLLLTLSLLPAARISAQKTVDTPDSYTEAVSRLYAQHPQARLQDFYKSFFQDRFGSGHLITDSAAVMHYLHSELDGLDTQPSVLSSLLYEPTGALGRYVRVYLRAVQDSLVSAEQLGIAFIRSATTRTTASLPAETWTAEWHRIALLAASLTPPLPGFSTDSTRIDDMLRSEGDVAVTHSPSYRNAYTPHYRIIRRDIFEREILPLLSSDKVLIIFIDSGSDRKPLSQLLNTIGAETLYTYRHVPAIAVRIPTDRSTSCVVSLLNRLSCVTGVMLDSVHQLD